MEEVVETASVAARLRVGSGRRRLRRRLAALRPLMEWRHEFGGVGVTGDGGHRAAQPLVEPHNQRRVAVSEVGGLRHLRAGVTPGARVSVDRTDGTVTVGAPGSDSVLDLPDEVARHIFVEAV